MDTIKLSPPWITYVNELKTMFEQDSEIRIVYLDDEEDREVKLYVSDLSKAKALYKILPLVKSFGSTDLKVTVVFPNEDDENEDILKTFRKAFKDNPVLEYTYGAATPIGNHRYVVFKNEVVQFYNDQLDDINGNKTTLYQDIAKELFKEGLDVHYCTEAVKDTLTKPLGEWP